jgi:chromosome segregation ATPase
MLDSSLKDRLRAVLEWQPVTEAELRRLAEEGDAGARILRGQLERAKHRLAALSADPTSSLSEIAAALRRVNEVQPELEEMQALLTALQARAREFRASWLSTS